MLNPEMSGQHSGLHVQMCRIKAGCCFAGPRRLINHHDLHPERTAVFHRCLSAFDTVTQQQKHPEPLFQTLPSGESERRDERRGKDRSIICMQIDWNLTFSLFPGQTFLSWLYGKHLCISAKIQQAACKLHASVLDTYYTYSQYCVSARLWLRCDGSPSGSVWLFTLDAARCRTAGVARPARCGGT